MNTCQIKLSIRPVERIDYSESLGTTYEVVSNVMVNGEEIGATSILESWFDTVELALSWARGWRKAKLGSLSTERTEWRISISPTPLPRVRVNINPRGDI